MYVPTNTPNGLIIQLHGAGGNGKSQCESVYANMNKVFENLGVIVVCPTAREVEL